MTPMLVAQMLAGFRRRRVGIVALEPAGDVDQIDLLAPEHAGKSLTLDAPFVFARPRGVDGGIKVVGFLLAESNDFVDRFKGAHLRPGRQAQSQNVRSPSGHENLVINAGLRAREGGIDTGFALDQMAVECVFYKRLAAG